MGSIVPRMDTSLFFVGICLNIDCLYVCFGIEGFWEPRITEHAPMDWGEIYVTWNWC